MLKEVKEIQEIQFGLLSPDDVLKMSVAEITNGKIISLETGSLLNTIYDERMGPMQSNQVCVTCKETTKECTGHFGHIKLNFPVLHPLYHKLILTLLKLFCTKCSRFLATSEHLHLWEISKVAGDNKLKLLTDILSKTCLCVHCNTLQPKYSMTDGDFFVSQGDQRDKLEVFHIQTIFERIIDDDLHILGFNPTQFHPNWLLLRVLPVLPPRARPFITNESRISDDDLTIQYCEIIKINNTLESPNMTPEKFEKNMTNLSYKIKTLMDNSNGKAKHTNSRQIKGIKERLSGKQGLIRSNLMGKRTDYSARTVIGPDVTLGINEIAVPEDIALKLTYPERVFDHNIEYLKELLDKGKINWILRNGSSSRINVKILQDKNIPVNLKRGDIVERQLQTGDIVATGRQPSLHKGSLLAMRAIIRPNKTIRFNLGIMGSFNGDFDGDEMNIYVPQSEQSRAELYQLLATEKNLVNAQASKPSVSIVQDSLLGAYLMTRNNNPIPRENFVQMWIHIKDSLLDTTHIDRIHKIYKELGVTLPYYCGKVLFSLLLPHDLVYSTSNLKIYKGVLYDGIVTKANLGSNAQSLLRIIEKEYNEDVIVSFINNVQYISHAYLLYNGFTIGIKDCITTKHDEIQDYVSKCIIEAQQVDEHGPEHTREFKILMALNKAKDVGMRIAKESMAPDNNFIATVQSGSKGDYMNISQITGLLGQQHVSGGRAPMSFNRNRRSLPHYKIGEKNFEARGFVRNSFINGISPEEFWFANISARESLTDTSTKTSNSGYAQRRLTKVLEDLQVQYDGTVRNASGNIIQFMYGNDNLCGSKSVLKSGNPIVCDVERLADRLNCQYENEH